MYRLGFVKLVIRAFAIRRKRLIIEEQKHQHVGLLDHVVAIDSVVRPMVVQRKIGDGNGMNIDVRQIEKALVLFKDPPTFVEGQIGLCRGFFDARAKLGVDPQFRAFFGITATELQKIFE